jgi:hypothetical protein
MAINDQTLSTDVFTDLRNLLVAANLQTTTQTTGAVTTASILAAYNDKVPAKPQVVLTPASISESDYKFGGSRGKRFINVTVDCYGDTTLACNQLQDQVVYTVSETGVAGLNLVGYTSDYAMQAYGDNKFHLKSITFNFDRE